MGRLSKKERYFSGMPIHQDASEPLPGEVSDSTKATFIRIGWAVGLLGVGALLGVGLTPASSEETAMTLATVRAELEQTKETIAALKRDVISAQSATSALAGVLKPVDRARHIKRGAQYAASLRRAKAQPASELIEWFVVRWNELLNHPQPDDRIKRRAAVLSRLVGSMGRNLDPGDYIPWQAEFFSGNWLGELHFDLDGDGLPGKRSMPNRNDGFDKTSVCHVAMALNQALSDALILMMPGMRCDSPKARISVFLNGRTMGDALNEFVKALRRDRFLVKDRKRGGIRMILVGQR